MPLELLTFVQIIMPQTARHSYTKLRRTKATYYNKTLTFSEKVFEVPSRLELGVLKDGRARRAKQLENKTKVFLMIILKNKVKNKITKTMGNSKLLEITPLRVRWPRGDRSLVYDNAILKNSDNGFTV